MIGEQFAGRLSGRPPQPFAEDDDGCPVCFGPHGRCVTAPAVAQDKASMIRELAVARGQQQTRRAPGRPLDDPAKEAARQAAWEARQGGPEVEPAPEPAPEAASTAVDPAAVATPAATPPVATAVPTVSEAPVVAAPDPSVQTLSPMPTPGPVVDPDAGSPRFTDVPTLVRTGDGAFRTQGVDAGAAAGLATLPDGDPREVRDCYVVPEGVIDPLDDPHRPDPAHNVLVSDASQLIATGAWTSLPGDTSIATTRRVLRVWYPMGTLSPCYSTVADRGAVLPKPAGAR